VIARSHRKSVYQPRPASWTKCRSFPFISLTIGSPLDTLMPTRVKEAQPAPPCPRRGLRVGMLSLTPSRGERTGCSSVTPVVTIL